MFQKNKMIGSNIFDPKIEMDSIFYHHGSSPNGDFGSDFNIRKFSDHLLASKSQVGRRILSLMVKIARGFSFARPDFLTDSVSQIRNNLAYFKVDFKVDCF